MAEINMRWTGGTQYTAADEAGHVVVTDQEGNGFKPPLLMLVSLVGCAGVDVVHILEKQRQAFTGIDVSISKENAPDPPWTITKIETNWVVRGAGLKQKAVERAVRLALEKYCSVSASLTSELVTTVRIVDDDTGGSEA
jgi:putative redox protein